MNSQSIERRVERVNRMEEFEDFDFTSIVWSEVKNNDGNFDAKRYYYSQDVIIEGIQFSFQASRVDSHLQTKYRFRIAKDKKAHMYGELTVDKKDKIDVVSEYVERQDVEIYNDPILPKNFATKFFSKLIDYVPNIKEDRRLLHRVQVAPRDGNRDRWDRIFLPILIENGYSPKHGDWEKEY